MRRIFNILVALIISICMLLLSGCSQKITLTEYKAIKSSSSEDIIITNSKYSMSWDGDKKIISLKDNETGLIWSTTPETALNNDVMISGKKNNPQTEAAVIVTYYDTEKYVQNTLISSTDAIKYGKVYAKKMTNDTIFVIYDFSKAKISVVVEYKLTSDGLCMSVNPKRISEGKEKIVTNIALAPFFCAVDNNSDNSYIFIPSGSGTLIYPKIKTNNASLISEEVYGEDMAVNNEFETTTTADVRIPVYGSIIKDKGMMAIIEDGASSCSIVSSSGNESLNYTTVYADFAVRGFEVVEQPEGIQASSNISKVAKVYSNPNNNNLKIHFMPLQGEDISYVTIAKNYKSYLISKYNLNSKSADESVSLRIIGGIMSTEFDFGIPHSALKPLTTIKEAENIINDLEELFPRQIIYNLDGFGSTGLDVGEIAGGYKINSRLGSERSLKKLFKESINKDINLFINFDLIRYNKSNSGFSTYFDASVAATQKRITKYFPSIITKNADLTFESYKLLKPSELFDASEKLTKFLDKNSIRNVSLDTLSNKLYSDYSNEKYYCKSGTDEIEKVFKSFSNDGYKIFSSTANDYTAVYSDYIDKTPLSSSNYDAYDVDVPFYQIVFSHLVPMYSQNWGSTGDDIELLLKAIESGIGISMSTVAQYDAEILSSPHKTMYSYAIDNVKTRMTQLNENKFFDYYSKIKDATIIDHILINNDVRKTVFDNGIEVYVNFSSNDFENDSIKIKAKSYILKGVDKQ